MSSQAENLTEKPRDAQTQTWTESLTKVTQRPCWSPTGNLQEPCWTTTGAPQEHYSSFKGWANYHWAVITCFYRVWRVSERRAKMTSKTISNGLKPHIFGRFRTQNAPQEGGC